MTASVLEAPTPDENLIVVGDGSCYEMPHWTLHSPRATEEALGAVKTFWTDAEKDMRRRARTVRPLDAAFAGEIYDGAVMSARPLAPDPAAESVAEPGEQAELIPLDLPVPPDVPLRDKLYTSVCRWLLVGRSGKAVDQVEEIYQYLGEVARPHVRTGAELVRSHVSRVREQASEWLGVVPRKTGLAVGSVACAAALSFSTQVPGAGCESLGYLPPSHIVESATDPSRTDEPLVDRC